MPLRPAPANTLTPTSIATFFKRALVGLLAAQGCRIAFRYYSLTPTAITPIQAPRTTMPKAAVICLTHGGGPLPLTDDPTHETIIYSLKNRVPKVLGLGTPNQPRAIVLVTAHWQTNTPTISSAKKHKLLYDYYGFPKETYNYKFDAEGDPEIAREIAKAITAEGLIPVLDTERGWDHGVFVPMLLVTPKADVPIVQISVLQSEDPAAHFRIGAALSKLRDQNIAIVGSGFASFHSLRLMMEMMHDPNSKKSGGIRSMNIEWSKVLNEAVATVRRSDRLAKLGRWREFPNSNIMHPPHGGDHFMPLLVCAAAAGDESAGKYSDSFLDLDIDTFYWGADRVE
ncbi:4,5-DOPA dioxygenase extradiol-like protein [Ceratocystis fimbriata CBS 114723]|uniref:4,5-DOPA dioxygenase extradiol-like protein n=1 Tax=Ceratocystis fimbriata CBS 114723 TaxID=1035309 RepID=A0A2C5WCG1_9PEZI|nr:4,5-DOPA dioxygenase extradiol-like protein [Ceratocystis fimbriata CBS 114723]